MESNKMHPVLIELNAIHIATQDLKVIEKVLQEKASSFKIDMNYPLIPMQDRNKVLYSYLVKGEIDEIQLDKLSTSNEVVEVFKDSSISPFG